jgi:predicted nucleic acid-binding protein
MIVVDSTVVPYLVIEGELTEEVRVLHGIDPDWVTPPILNHEILDVLAAVGAGENSWENVERIWKDLRQLLGSRQQIPDPVRSLRIAVENDLPGHEAQYLCLAASLGVPLVTESPRLLKVTSKAVTVRELIHRMVGAS